MTTNSKSERLSQSPEAERPKRAKRLRNLAAKRSAAFREILERASSGKLTQRLTTDDSKFKKISPRIAKSLRVSVVSGKGSARKNEQEFPISRFLKLVSKPSDKEKAFFAERRRAGLGVGLSETGELIYARDMLPDTE